MIHKVYTEKFKEKVIILDKKDNWSSGSCCYDIDFKLVPVSRVQELINKNKGILDKELLEESSYTVNYIGVVSPYAEFLVELKEEPPFEINLKSYYEARRLQVVEKVIKTFE